ncbi:MAG: PAS domain-containing protein [bacterium]|nr:PAS domain-containing protein [bacterium]
MTEYFKLTAPHLDRGTADAATPDAQQASVADTLQCLAAVGLTIADGHGRLVYASPAFAAMVGWAPDELLGRTPPLPFWPPEDIPALSALYSATAQDSAPRRYLRHTGECFAVALTVLPLPDDVCAGGRVTLALDLTHDRHVCELASHAQRVAALNRLAAGFAHEVSNPCNFISVNIEVLERLYTGMCATLDTYCQEHGEVQVAGMPYASVRADVAKLLTGIKEGARRIRATIRELQEGAHAVPMNADACGSNRANPPHCP